MSSYSSFDASIIVANISKREFLNVIYLLRQLFHVFAQFFLGNLGIHLGFYYVHVAGIGTYECKAKGGFRNQNIKPLVGDNVEIDIVDEEKLLGNIVGILPRSSQMIRPAVANVDQALLVFAISSPAPNLRLLDSFLVMMEGYELPTIICFNKIDEAQQPELPRLADIYRKSVYR